MKFAHDRQYAEPHRPRPRRVRDVLSPVEGVEGSPFEPRRDIPLRMQKIMLRYVQGAGSLQVDESTYLKVAAPAITMFPEMRESLQLVRQCDSSIRDLVEHVQEDVWDVKRMRENSWPFLTRFSGVGSLITCYPEARQQLPIDTIKAELISFIENERSRQILLTNYAIILLLMVDPESRDKIVLDEKLRKASLMHIQADIHDDSQAIPFERMRNFALLFPDHKDELPLTPEFWDFMRELLHKDRNPLLYALEAEAMTILAAKRAEIGQNGLIHITPRQSRLKKAVPVPDRPHV